MKCEECGNEVFDGDVYCRNCGTELANEVLNCECGAEVLTEDNYCHQCGAAFTETVEESDDNAGHDKEDNEEERDGNSY